MPHLYVVDDSPTDRNLTVRFLKKHRPDADILTFENGADALRGFEALAEDAGSTLPALVFLDQRMPKMNGDQLMARLRSLTRLDTVPFVLFSSSVLEEDIRLCLRNGCASYVRKPLEYREYERVVGAVADYWLEINAATSLCHSARVSLH